MKRQWIIAVAVLGIAPIAGPALAQEVRAVAGVSGQAASTGTRTIMGTVASRITTDRPYSAEAVNESLQLLPDGNKIHRTTVTRVYRDSAGRTRREMLNEDGSVRSITISDPVSKISYALDPASKTATKGGAAVASMAGSGEGVRVARTAEGSAVASRGGGGSVGATAGVATITRGGAGGVAGTVTAVGGGNREALDPQVIEGLNATGTRTTTIIPAGQVGNAQEIKIVSEQWTSDELQLLVMTKHSDPRSGESVYRLRNVLRAEPDPSLFAVPADYTIQERR
jgi:hypothetical protein